ncbi:MAG: hypothetical protein ACHP85_21750 [Burkholderiales bacterium]
MSALRPLGAELAAAVSARELLRLVGLPRGRELAAELRERAQAARAWYAAHGRPFAATRRCAVERVSAGEVLLAGGTTLRSDALAEGLRASRGHAVVVLAVSAGPEAAVESRRLWPDRPDEAYFLDRFAAAVAEALVLWASGHECREASGAGETLLPPLSPGCGRFEIGDQQRLMQLLGGTPTAAGRLQLGPLELLETGALDPQHSLLAVLGVTRQSVAAAAPEDLCRACELEPCGFRRAPFGASLALVALTR